MTHISRYNTLQRLALALGLAAVGSAQAAESGYAESLYSDFEAASKGQVKFNIQPLRSGAVQDLAGYKLVALTGTPTYTLTTVSNALEIDSAKFDDANMKSLYLEGLDAEVNGFAEAGFPLEKGNFRQLEVQVTMGKDQRTHTAAEFCWADQGHCTVFDPSIEFLDSLINGQRERRAQGWAPTVRGELASAQGLEKAGTCGLASHPTWKAAQITWGSYRVSLRNIYGIEIGHKNIGSAQAGLRCNTSCYPAPYGYSNNSSASIIFPNSVQCDFAHAQGTSGRSGKYIGKTGCSHRFVLGAKFNATAKGVGLGVDVQIDSTGSVHQNGGAYVDTCGYF